MPEYLVEEFTSKSEPCPLNEQIDKKVSLLYDLCILRRKGMNEDEREQAIRELFASYGSEIAMDNVVRSLIMGNYTLNDFLKRKGYLQ